MRTVLGLAVVLVACSGADQDTRDRNEPVAVAPDWVRVEASCGNGYSFSAPPEIAKQPAQGIDSCVERWTTSTCTYLSDYGWYSDDLTGYAGMAQYERSEQSIDGRPATIVTALSEEGAFIAAVHVGGIDPALEKVALTLSAQCTDDAGRRDALVVFETLAFAPGG